MISQALAQGKQTAVSPVRALPALSTQFLMSTFTISLAPVASCPTPIGSPVRSLRSIDG